jgi:molecular chaperone GrpE
VTPLPQDPRADGPEQEVPVIRDKRRIDPTTGALREPGTHPAPAPPVGADRVDEQEEERREAGRLDDRLSELEAQLSERTSDVQRVHAEFANYRRRVERDRETHRELALVNVLTDLLPILDDIGRAREHGELEGGFRSVAEALEATVSKLGLQRFGDVGEPFDPTVHEAIMHADDDGVAGPTCVAVIQPGYRFGSRVVRPARVAVAEPAD